jgi:cytochrome c55X
MKASVLLVLSLLAVQAGADELISASRQQDLKSLLIQDCGSCHGLQMKGGLGPALLASDLQGKSTAYISSIILDGKPGTAMPAWRPLITPAEARWLADLLMQETLQ